MGSRLATIAAETAFPLFAVHPRHWDGAVMVGAWTRAATGAIQSVQLLYVSPDERSHGFSVTNWEPSGAENPFDAHVFRLAGHFDQTLVRSGLRVRRLSRFEFRSEPETIASIGGAEGTWHRHRRKPFELVRARARRFESEVEIGVAAFRMRARDLAALLEPVTERFAEEFDRRAMPEPDAPWAQDAAD